MIKKSFIVSLFLLISFVSSAYLKPDVYKIDATQNAILHNSLGLKAVSEQNYFEAIQEFCLAISLNPRTQATAVYYNNLGETYMKVGYYREAQRCFESSIIQYNLNFLYYQNLVKSFKAQGLIGSKIKYYQSKEEKNPMNKVVLGLLYVASGDVRRGIIKLDEFCMSEPDLLITGAVKNYISTIVPKD